MGNLVDNLFVRVSSPVGSAAQTNWLIFNQCYILYKKQQVMRRYLSEITALESKLGKA